MNLSINRLLYLMIPIGLIATEAMAGKPQSLVKVNSSIGDTEIKLELNASGTPIAVHFLDEKIPMARLKAKDNSTALGDGKFGVDVPVPEHPKVLALHVDPLPNGEYDISIHYAGDYRKTYKMKLARDGKTGKWILKEYGAGTISCLFMGRKRTSMVIRSCDGGTSQQIAGTTNRNVPNALQNATVFEGPSQKRLPAEGTGPVPNNAIKSVNEAGRI